MIYKIHCSSLPRIEMCPGSVQAEKGIESASDDLALSGQIIHAALQCWARGKDPDDGSLTEREKSIYYWFRREVEAIEANHGGYMIRLPELQLKLKLYTQGEDEVWLVGRLDLMVIPVDGTKHLIDYKTGFAEQIPAKKNRQLTGYSVMMVKKRPEWVPLNAHLFSAGDPKESRFTLTQYGPDDVVVAEGYLRKIIKAALSPKAKRIPGPHCQYCTALATKRCPETASAVVKIDNQIKVMPSDLLPVPAKSLEIFGAIKAVGRFAKAFLPALKEAVMKDPEAWAGQFTLHPGSKKRVFPSVEAACNRLIKDEGVAVEDIWRIIKLTPAQAEKLVVEKQYSQKDGKGPTVKSIKEYFNGAFNDLILKGETAPSLKVVK